MVWAAGVVVAGLLFDNPVYVAALLGTLLLVAVKAGVIRSWLSAMRPAVWLGASVVLINAVVSQHGAHVLATAPFSLPMLGTPAIHLEALAYGGGMALKLLVALGAFAILNLTLHPDDMMDNLLRLRLPYRSVLVASLSTRFVPCILEDAGRIRDAYQTRGLELGAGCWLKRVANGGRLLVPLLANSLDRAVQVAEAMESRAFGLRGRRSFYRQRGLGGRDAGALLCAVALGLLGVVIHVLGYDEYQFYPTMQPISLNPVDGLLMLVLFCVTAGMMLAAPANEATGA
jgi:energy-coupling factor transport system permease protein